MKAGRVHQALDHRHKKSARPTSRLNRPHPHQIAISAVANEIKNQVDDPSPGEDLAMLLGSVRDLDFYRVDCH